MKKAVFLDRDGVINKSILIDGVPTPPKNVFEVEILEGVIQAINLLESYKFVPIVITNQPDVARGTFSQVQVEEINTYIGFKTNLKYFYTCFHDDSDNCECRKPKPGLIHIAASELEIDIPSSFLVGDRWRDIAAAQAAGCDAFFIDHSYQEASPELPFKRVESLLQAVHTIIGGAYAS